MKKMFSIVLTLMMVFSLVACGNGGTEESSAPEEISGSESSAVPEENTPSSESTVPAESASQVEESSQPETETGSASLVVYFSWSGNTESVANEIQAQTGADIFEIVPAEPYTDDYNTLLDIAQNEQANDARPAIAQSVENFDRYETVYFGFPNWWASIPMPIASFLEEYDFAGKTIIPFCSHGGGRFGQSLTAIAKLTPDAAMGKALSIHYSGGSSMPEDVSSWLAENGISGG